MIKSRSEVSRLRKRLAELPSEISRRIEGVLAERRLGRGAIYHVRLRCGKPSCHCYRGRRHEAWMLRAKLHGKFTCRSLSEARARKLSPLTESYRRLRGAKRDLRGLFREAMELIGELEEALSVEWEEILKEGAGTR